MPLLKQDNQEDQLNPATKHYSDDSHNPNTTAKKLQSDEQQAAFDRDFDEITRPENYARDGKNAADEVKDQEKNPYGYQHSGDNGGTARRQGGKRTIKGTLRGALGGKKGPIAALISLLVGGGAAFSVFLVPGMGIVHFKEMLTDKLDDQIGAVNMRSNVLIRNKLNDSKKSTFEINDNLLRFYFTYVYKNASALQVLGAEAFYDEYVAPTLTDFISRRFEGICRDYFSLQVRSGKLKGVRNIGSYYYDDPVHRKNGEFDVALELADGYAIYEAKYYAQPMTLDEIHREAQQVANIKELAVKQLGFIAINGFVEQEKPYTYLDGNDIFAGM